jgi:6-phosphogluconolactonase (cycloisomerase 2 family)
MKALARFALAAGAVVGLSAVALPAVAGAAPAPTLPAFAQGGDHAVFVQTDNTAGNQIVAYHRNANGTLAPAGTYATGGLGGVLNGSAVDHLASQGSLTFDPVHNLLYAVNAGSNTVSVFSVYGDQLFLRQVINSGGQFPVSVAVHGDNVYVLNALSANVQGYISFFGRLFPLPDSDRSLGLTVPSNTNQFTNTPGQVAVSPNGTELIVTTKLNNDDIDVFHIGFFGTLSASPVVTSDPGGPFGVTFDAAGHLVVANTASNSLTTYVLEPNGTAVAIDTVLDGQAATCWVTGAQGSFFASNAGSADLSHFSEQPFSGALTLAGETPTNAGTVDATTSPDQQFLYVQTGANGIVDEFQVGPGGSLTAIGSVTVPGAVGGEGIAAL